MTHFPRIASRLAVLGSVLSSASVLAACASVPDLGPAPTAKAPASYASAQTFAAPAAEWPSDQWWQAYGDPQLSALIDEALKDSPSMVAADARLRKAEALTEQAGAALKPRLSGSIAANAAEIQSSGFGDIVPGGLGANGYALLQGSFDLDLWGKNKAALAAATSDAQAARADAAQARLTLSTSVASAYADLAQLYSDLDAADEALAVRKQTLDLLSQRFTNGLENRGASQQAEAGRASAEADIAALNEAIGLNKNRLAALIGAGPDRGLTIARPAAVATKAFGLPGELPAQLIGRRPDIVAARLRAEAAVSRTSQAKASFYPNVNLSLMGAGLSPDLGALTSQVLGLGVLGPAVSLPIFEGGRLEAQYKGARADHATAVADYDKTLTQALHDVADVAVSQRALTTRLTATRQALVASEQAHQIAMDRYTGGLSTYLDVLRAEDLLITNRRAVADLQTRAFTLDIALVRALGGGFAADRA